MQDVQESWSNLVLVHRFLQILLFIARLSIRSCTCKESGRKCPFSCTDLARQLLSVFSHQEQKEQPNFVQVKGQKYLSFFHFPKIRAGKFVKQVNKFAALSRINPW